LDEFSSAPLGLDELGDGNDREVASSEANLRVRIALGYVKNHDGDFPIVRRTKS
jgi:hypothetical protein